MSLHPSLRGQDALASKKSVLKRGERIKWLMDKKKWDEEQSVLGLPKIKVVKIKLAKKEKKEEKAAEEAAATNGSAAPAGEKKEKAS